jgi:hypothetical protein
MQGTRHGPGRTLAVVALMGLGAGGCSAGSWAKGSADSGGGYGYADGGSDGADGSDGGSWDTGYAPEEPDEDGVLPPATTDRYVFVANPERDTVTRIAASTLAVITTDVGVNPEVVRTTSDYSTAAVFNLGSDSVSVVDAESLAVVEVPVRPNLNQMVLSPSGRFVACFHDASQRDEFELDEGAVSFNEVSLVDLQAKAHVPLVVGFNPREIRFTPDGDTMVVVSDSYLAIVDLSADTPEPVRVRISEDTVDPPLAEELVLTPDGRYAIVRQFGGEDLVVVDLSDYSVERVDVGDDPTDIDVTPDGLRAVAVARGSHELWLYELNDIFAAPTTIPLPETDVLGSLVLSPDGSKGLLYSTASGLSRFASWDLSEPDPALAVTSYATVKPVQSVRISPSGNTAMMLHDDSNGDTDPDSVFYNEHALTLLSLTDFFANPIRLPAEPEESAVSEDGELGFLILEDERYFLQLDFQSLIHESIELKSVPEHIGVLPESQTVYISQDHELGRISFYDAQDGSIQTVTGFELNSGIEY